jgi:phage/plasmid-associated DNA primase
VPFTHLFIGKNDDKDKLKKMTTPTELSGLLNLALAGLKRLLKNGDFTNSKTIEENRELYIRSSDSCKAFAEECLEESDDPEDCIATESLYQSYVSYVKKNRLPTVETKPRLTHSIRHTFPNAEQAQERVLTRRIWVWRYLKKKSVTSVTTVTGIPTKKKSKSKLVRNRTPVTPVTFVTKEEGGRVCGQCACWHKPGCSYPDADPSCVALTNKYAVNCRGFISQEASQ